jgi:CTP:molybdopterin cytidylyltransferase MocA
MRIRKPDDGLARVAVVILAAGSGRRLGLGPKAHVVLGGGTFLDRIVRTCRKAGLGTIYVVGSAADARIDAVCASLQVRLVVNPEPARGMSSSVAVGLEAVRVEANALATLVFPVDFPLVRENTLRLVALALEPDRESWSRPLFDGEGGHPIAIDARLVARVLALGPHVPLRDALHTLGVPSTDVTCDDAGVVSDVDLPEDLLAARRALP